MNQNDNKNDNSIKQPIFTKETLGVVMIIFSTLCLVCLVTRDKVFSVPGEILNSFLFGLFGVFAYAVTVWGLLTGIMFLLNKTIGFSKRTIAIFTIITTCIALFSHILNLAPYISESYGKYISLSYSMAEQGGISTCSASGAIMSLLAYPLSKLLTPIGASVVVAIVALCGIYYLVKDYLDYARSKPNNPEKNQKFRNTYTPVQNNSQKINISGEKDYPVAGVNFDAPKTQSLFINDENSFAVLSKRELAKDNNTAIKLERAEGGLYVAKGSPSYKQTYSNEMESKIAYIKTPAMINLDDKAKSGYYSSGVSSAIPRTPDYKVNPIIDLSAQTPIVNQQPSVEQEVKREESVNIPLYKHNESTDSDSLKERSQTFSDKYVNFSEEPKQDNSEQNSIVDFSDNNDITEQNTDNIKQDVQDVSEIKDYNQDEELKEEFNKESYDDVPSSNIKSEKSRSIFYSDKQNSVSDKEDDKDNDFDIEVKNSSEYGSRGKIENSILITPKTVNREKAEPEKIEKPKPPINRIYNRPPLDLLETFTPPTDIEQEDHQGRMQIIKETLAEFHITVEPENYIQGPTVTRYEIKVPSGMGISVKKIPTCDDDLKMRLSSREGIRIEAPIPGKNLVGIEVANKHKITVGLKELLKTQDFNSDKKGSLMFALGKDIVGNSKFDDLTKGPHYLIAGTTGSGKSVCLNLMIVSMIMRYSPEELRLILVDPKGVEFVPYEHLPHLMIDEIVTEPKKALAVLQWGCEEMERRYATFKTAEGGTVVDINSYNKQIEGKNIPKMPRIVIIVDELSNLMESCKKELEQKILSLAQKARAAGIHLVLATQRPSVDVITGVIKANLPSRIGLKVSSFADSNTILNEAGAEKLLGNGDMLYKNSGMSESERYQGAYITTSEINNVVKYIIDNNSAYFDDELQEYLNNSVKPKMEDAPENGEEEDPNEFDDFFIKALWFAVSSGSVAISQLQRRFQIGYARAGGLVDKMERFGFVSSFEGSKARRVLLTKEEFENRFGTISDNY